MPLRMQGSVHKKGWMDKEGGFNLQKYLALRHTSISALTVHQKFLEKTMHLTHKKLRYVGASICQLVVQMIVILGLQKWKKKFTIYLEV